MSLGSTISLGEDLSRSPFLSGVSDWACEVLIVSCVLSWSSLDSECSPCRNFFSVVGVLKSFKGAPIMIAFWPITSWIPVMEFTELSCSNVCESLEPSKPTSEDFWLFLIKLLGWTFCL